MEARHQNQVAHNVDHARDAHKEQRQIGVAQPPEDTTDKVVKHNEDKARAADADIEHRQLHRLGGGLHQPGQGPGKGHHDHRQPQRQQKEKANRAANQLSDAPRLSASNIAPHDHRDACGQRTDAEGHQIQNSAPGGDAGNAGRSAELADNQQIDGAVHRL